MSDSPADLTRRLERLERQVARERAARAESERLLESKSRELYATNQRLLALNADLEDRIRARTAEAERQRRAAQIANERVIIAAGSGRIGIWDFDIVTGTLAWDDMMRKLYGVTDEDDEAAYDMWARRVHPADRAAAEKSLWSAINEDTVYDIEFRIVRPDASLRHIRAAARVIRDASGQATNMIGVNWDVTEERRLAADLKRQIALQAETAEREIKARAERDAAEQAARAKSEFLATMSHEIRSPLSALLGVLDVLRGSPLEAEQRRMTNMAHNSAAMLLAVLNDVLDFSKIEAGAMTIEPRPTELRRMLDDLMHPHIVAAEAKGLATSLCVDQEVPDMVLTDALRVQQIVGNLLSNARKFTETGGIAVHVTVPRGMASPMLRIDVRDTGIGISAAALDKIFLPFTQADNSTTRVYGGTGLGLAISRKLAEKLQGSLSASSASGLGSVFSLLLPLIPCTAPDELVAKTESAHPVRLHAGKLALVVDDDSTIRWLSERQLKSLGFTVETAPDGEAALQRFVGGSFALVLTDCHMPRMDGVALTKAIRALPGGHGAHVPIIGLTADVTETQRQRCLDAGMTDLAIKPLTTERLSKMLDHRLKDTLQASQPDAPKLRQLPFDDTIYLSIFERGDADGRAWLEEYVASARDDVVALSSLAHAPGGLPAELPKIAHRLAGASFSVGAVTLGTDARALERAALEGRVSNLGALADELTATFAEATVAIATFLGTGVSARVNSDV